MDRFSRCIRLLSSNAYLLLREQTCSLICMAQAPGVWICTDVYLNEYRMCPAAFVSLIDRSARIECSPYTEKYDGRLRHGSSRPTGKIHLVEVYIHYFSVYCRSRGPLLLHRDSQLLHFCDLPRTDQLAHTLSSSCGRVNAQSFRVNYHVETRH